MAAQPQPTRTYNFAGGSNAVADEVDTDLNTLYTVLQGGIGDTHIASDAAISWSKLASVAWTSFTPTWTGLTLGNGTSSASYQQIGKWVIFKGRLTCGSTTNTTGTGNPLISDLPVTASAATDYGAAHITDSSAGNNQPAICTTSSTTALTFYSGSNSTQAVAGGYPTGYFTAGAGNSTGDTLSWTIVYQAA